MFSFCFINLLYQESGAIYLIILMLLLSIYMGVQQHMRMSYCRVSLVSTHSELCPVQG